MLEQLELFHGLSHVDQARLIGKLVTEHYKAGATVFEHGDAGDSMYIVRSGRVELFTVAPDGRKHSLTVLGEASAFGEMALLTGEPRSASAITVSDTVLLRMNVDTFQELVDEYPSFSAYFIRLLSQRLVRTNRDLEASKGQKQKHLVEELEALPDSLRWCLLSASIVPAFHNQWAERDYGVASIHEALADRPLWQAYVQPLDDGPDWFTIHSSVKSTLAEVYVSSYGVRAKTELLSRTGQRYLDDNKLFYAVQLHVEQGDWATALELMRNLGDEHSGNSGKSWNPGIPDEELRVLRLLDACPNEMLFREYDLYVTYLKIALEEEARESELARLEQALGQSSVYFSGTQTVQLYEVAAEFCHRLQHHQKAMEYLQLAAAATTTAPDHQEEGRSFLLAKQNLDLLITAGKAENAVKWWTRSRFTGWIAIALALASVGFFQWSPPFGGLSHEGMVFIGVALAAVVLWIVNIIPDYLVALFMAMYWVLAKLVTPEVALSGYASPTWIYMLCILALGAAISKSGILYRVSLYALKAFPKHYQGQLWGMIASGLLLNPLIPSSSAKVALGVPIAGTVSEAMGFAPRSKGSAGLGLAGMIFFGFTAPFFMTGSYTNVMAYSLAGDGEEVTWLNWFVYAFPALLVFLAGMWLWITMRYKPKKGEKPTVSEGVLVAQLRILGKLTKEEKVTSAVTLGCVALLMLQPIHHLDNAWVMLLGFSALVIGGVLDTKTLLNRIDWTFLLFIGIAFSFAAVASELGITEVTTHWVGAFMKPFMGNPALFLVAVIVISSLVTLVVRDDPAVILLVISMLPLAQEVGIHPWVLVFVILLSTDPFFFTYQSPTYLTAYYSTNGKLFNHRQAQLVAVGYIIVIAALAVACIPYWKWLGLIQ
ncbi:di/tricarboxylate transporter [Paenibacillus taihuensis]|uniref:Sodium-dependent dicarboxylate transporter SdcS n=1 Tax=Paenibacillus taihuensis TaxID=1156355 RepID=A0A3D9SBL4_9BACL|nr:SLC13 family permease [Paenibacillus taihuensis]REE90654.1 di/tricarboxylate transporter [Paenibacillus taihuensis]